MPNANIFAGLGLFTRRGFLDAETCRQIRNEMTSAARTPALVRPVGEATGTANELARRTGIAEVSAGTTALVRDRLLAAKPALEQHFQLRLAGCEELQFLIYGEGDFFQPHQDRGNDPLAPAHIKARLASVSILLNDQAVGSGREPYSGGVLVFYGRPGDGGATFGIPLQSEEGMCVAFRSDWIHEVRPITWGRRYSVVTWFH